MILDEKIFEGLYYKYRRIFQLYHPWLYSKTLHILISVFYAVINMYDSEAMLITSHSITP